MPELPEVETVIRAVKPHLVGRRIARAEDFMPKLRTPLTLTKDDSLIGSEFIDLRRRGKYIIAELDSLRAILFHLGMSGSFRIEAVGTARQKHDHLLIELDDGTSLRFNDPRRFGIAELHTLAEAGGEPDRLINLGPEPLGDRFTSRYLAKVCADRAMPIKNLIMNSHIVVGVGNIYANEALFRAGIRPTVPAGSISRKRLERLVQAIQGVLTDAIEAGGTTIHSFKTVDGSEGWFQRSLGVYGRGGDTCEGCGRGTIRRYVQGGRATYFCPVCQR